MEKGEEKTGKKSLKALEVWRFLTQVKVNGYFLPYNEDKGTVKVEEFKRKGRKKR